MLLGLDIGTSSCKTTLLDSQNGTIIASARTSLNYLYPDAVRAEINAEDLWQSVLDVLTRLTSQHPIEAKLIKALAISIVFPTLVPLDSAGHPLCNAILYNDRRSQPQVDAINRQLGECVADKITGNTLIPGTSILPGILWLKQNRPELDRQTATYATLGTFIIQRLTGARGMDPAHASLSALCPMGHEEQWSEKLLEVAGIPPERLPEVHEGLTVAGIIKPDIAERTGLPRFLQVVWSNGDAPLAAFGAGVARPGEVFAAGGSTDNIMVCANRPSGNTIFCNLRHIPAHTWVVNGTMSAAGASVKWLCESFLKCSMDELMAEAAQAPSGSHGLVFLPYLLGERTPVWDSHAKGVFLGLDLTTGRADACRAVLEGIACGWRQIIELLQDEYQFRPAQIITAGGGGTNRLWNQIKATMLDRPVISLAFNDVSSLGACLAAGVAAGVYADIQQAFDATAKLRNPTTVEPVKEWAEPLQASYQKYLKLYPAVKSLF